MESRDHYKFAKRIISEYAGNDREVEIFVDMDLLSREERNLIEDAMERFANEVLKIIGT